MDFKSTIIIFGVALIFILPLVISSPISGAKRGGGKSMGNENQPQIDTFTLRNIGYDNCVSTYLSFADKCIKTWTGGCDNWKSLRIARYDDHKYSVRDCHDLCSSTKSCAGFFISTKLSTYLKPGTCELYRDGCTKSHMNDWEYYTMETCNFGKILYIFIYITAMYFFA